MARGVMPALTGVNEGGVKGNDSVRTRPTLHVFMKKEGKPPSSAMIS